MNTSLCAVIVLLLLRPVVVGAQGVVIFDDFEYAVGRDDADKATPFRARGWTGVKTEPSPKNANGWIYTVTEIPGYTGAFPAGGKRVLAMEARPTTGGQTDFYLQLGNATSADSENRIPGEVWYQFWIYPQHFGTQLSQWSNRNKFFYVTRAGYPSHSHNYMIGDTNSTHNPLNQTPWGRPADGQFVFTLASADGGTSLVYDGPGADPDRGDKVGPQVLTEWMRPNRWTLVKMHINTEGEQGSWEVWLRAHGTAEWTKVADWKGGVTPGFQWKIPPSQRGGHRELRWPTTIGNANRDNPQHDYWLYYDDMTIATSEALLKVYSDAEK